MKLGRVLLAIAVVVAAATSLSDQFGVVDLPSWLSSVLSGLLLVSGVIVLFAWIGNYGDRDAFDANRAQIGKIDG